MNRYLTPSKWAALLCCLLVYLLLMIWAMPAQAAPVQILVKGGGYSAPQTMDVAIAGSITGPFGNVVHFEQGAWVHCSQLFELRVPAGMVENNDPKQYICVRDPPTGAPPVVEPPVTPPPTVQLPAGYTKIADITTATSHETGDPGTFQLAIESFIRLCNSDATVCSAVTRFPATGTGPGDGSFYCKATSFTSVPAGTMAACFTVPAPAPTLAYKPVCLPALTELNPWSPEWETGDVPEAISAGGKKYAVFRPGPGCASREVDARMGTYGEAWELLKRKFKTQDEVNAWAAQQPLEVLTDVEQAFLDQRADAFKLGLPVLEQPAPTPPPEPAVTYTVRKNGSYTTRPSYPVLDSIRATKKNGDVKIGSACDCGALRLDGTTTYCSVAGLPNEAKPGEMLPASSVAVCSTP